VFEVTLEPKRCAIVGAERATLDDHKSLMGGLMLRDGRHGCRMRYEDLEPVVHARWCGTIGYRYTRRRRRAWPGVASPPAGPQKPHGCAAYTAKPPNEHPRYLWPDRRLGSFRLLSGSREHRYSRWCKLLAHFRTRATTPIFGTHYI
jgi:hypothetical protein